MNTCACGCGQTILPKSTYAKGHYQRGPGGFHRLPPDEKTCERCGRTYHRSECGTRQSNKHWARRRYCSADCQAAALGDQAREMRGDAHPSFKGADGTAQAGRKRARHLYPDAPPCEVCADPNTERHHRNGDTHDNRPENVRFLCRKHHIQAEDRMAYRRKPMTPERLERKRALARERQRRYIARKKERPPS